MDAGLLSAVMISPRLGFLFRTFAVPEPSSRYRGRFAPSPTGPLHFGSLVAAVGSYLDARSIGGEWLVRMEDVDTPRNMPGAADGILRTLEAFGFEWDGAVLWQSRRFDAYAAALEQTQGCRSWPTAAPARARKLPIRRRARRSMAGWPIPVPAATVCRTGAPYGPGGSGSAMRRHPLSIACRGGRCRISSVMWVTSSCAGQTACTPINWLLRSTMNFRAFPTSCAVPT